MIFLSTTLLALATRQLATLTRGERLTGSVVGHHKNKLYVRVPGVVLDACDAIVCSAQGQLPSGTRRPLEHAHAFRRAARILA